MFIFRGSSFSFRLLNKTERKVYLILEMHLRVGEKNCNSCQDQGRPIIFPLFLGHPLVVLMTKQICRFQANKVNSSHRNGSFEQADTCNNALMVIIVFISAQQRD